jgi:hypothetical protein
MNHPLMALTTVLGLALAVPAAARAASLKTEFPCYIEQTPMRVIGTGYSADAAITVSAPQVFATTKTNNDGAFTTTVKAPIFPTVRPGSARYSVKAVETENTSVAATVSYRVTNFAFETAKSKASPKAKRRWTFSGFSPGKPIYGHFRFKNRTRGTLRFGTATGPCGELTAQAPGIAVKGHVSAGNWVVQVDQVKRYSKNTKPALRAISRVSLVFGKSSASALSSVGGG